LYCDHCFGPEEIERIRTTPLHELGDPEISQVASDAVYTLGNDRDFRHFLPRLIEVTVENSTSCEADWIFKRLPYVKAENWPGEERRAIERYFVAQFEAVLRGPPSPLAGDVWNVAELLRYASLAAIPLRPMLDSWRGRRDEFARRNLLWFLSESNSLPPDGPKLLTSGCWDEGVSRFEIRDWLWEPATLAACEAARAAFPGSNETISGGRV
jgi:hypothetical protein